MYRDLGFSVPGFGVGPSITGSRSSYSALGFHFLACRDFGLCWAVRVWGYP